MMTSPSRHALVLAVTMIGCGTAHIADDSGISERDGGEVADRPLSDAGVGMDRLCADRDADGAIDAACGGTDCDDDDAAVGPSRDESCNGVDDDCDAVVDEGGAALCTGPTPGSIRDCIDGACALIDCTTWLDCDGDASNGCEADPMTDPLNCGSCGVDCPGAAACIAEACTPTTSSLWVSGWEGDEYVYSMTRVEPNGHLVGAYNGVALDGSGRRFPSQGGWDAFLVQPEPNGVVVFGGPGDEIARDVGVYPTPYIYVFVGEFRDSFTYRSTVVASEGEADGFVMAIDFLHAISFLHVVGGTGDDRVVAITRTEYGTYIAGEFEGAVEIAGTPLTSQGQHDVFIAELDVAGDPVWITSIAGTGDERVVALSSTNSPTSAVYVAGSFESSAFIDSTMLDSAGGADAYWVELDRNDGSVVTAMTGGGTGLDTGRATLLGGDFEGTAMFGSSSVTSAGSRDIILIDPRGVDTRAFGSAGNEILAYYDAPYLAGTFDEELPHATRSILSAGGVDGFAGELSDDETTWAMTVAGPGTDTVVDASRRGADRLIVVGRFEGSAEIQGLPVTASGAGDIYQWVGEF